MAQKIVTMTNRMDICAISKTLWTGFDDRMQQLVSKFIAQIASDYQYKATF